MDHYIETYLNETITIAQNLDKDAIARAMEMLRGVKKGKGRLFIFGVGGSAANASHAVNDFRKICGIEAYAGTDNVSELTARTNDEGWETTFCEFLRVSHLCETDAVMILSVGGGNEHTSQNLVKAMELAKSRNAGIVSIVSRDGGCARKYSDVCILIPVLTDERITPHAEGWQGILTHLIVNGVKD